MSPRAVLQMVTVACALLQFHIRIASGQNATITFSVEGTGCPGGSTDFSVSPNRRVGTFIFSTFVAQGPPGESKTCALLLKLSTPAKWRSTPVNYTVRGYEDVAVPSTGEIGQSQVQVTGLRPGQPKDRAIGQPNVTLASFVGPYANDYIATASVADYESIAGISQCESREVTVTYDLTASLTGPGLVTIDSVDVALGYDVFWLIGRRCGK